MNKIENYITRKTLLYKTNVEYGDYTINHVEGCSHGCRYPCYAMMMARRFGKVKTYEEWIKPKLVENAVLLLEKEIIKHKDKINSVHFCFTTDPFMYQYPEVSELTIKLIKITNDHLIKCSALTKGILPVELAQLNMENEFGITLVSRNEKFREYYEPGTAPYSERINALYRLHLMGIKTWASIEPYPTPNIVDQDMEDILQSISFVDKIIFGKLNYNAKVGAYIGYKDYFSALTDTVLNFCLKNNKEYHIKRETSKILTQELREKPLSTVVVNY